MGSSADARSVAWEAAKWCATKWGVSDASASDDLPVVLKAKPSTGNCWQKLFCWLLLLCVLRPVLWHGKLSRVDHCIATAIANDFWASTDIPSTSTARSKFDHVCRKRHHNRELKLHCYKMKVNFQEIRCVHSHHAPFLCLIQDCNSRMVKVGPNNLQSVSGTFVIKHWEHLATDFSSNIFFGQLCWRWWGEESEVFGEATWCGTGIDGQPASVT